MMAGLCELNRCVRERRTTRNGRPFRFLHHTITIGSTGILVACGGARDTTAPVSLPLSYLSLFPDRRVAIVGEMFTLTVTARDTAGVAVPNLVPRYTSTDPGVLQIEGAGTVVVLGVGTARVQASAGGLTAETIIYVGDSAYDLATLAPPRVLPANYIDLSKIGRISRFRSTVGHSYTDGSETCRSMKHYYEPMATVDWTTLDVYAPASGTILGIATDGWGYRLRMVPRDLPVLQIQIFHVTPDSGIVRDMWVDAGDHLGRHASSSTMSDIAMSIGPKEGGTLISYFETMTDAVFAEYQARGVATREAAIITEEERDADPVPCVGEEQFTVHGTLPDWLVLN
jgi:hypothetical protein